MPVHDFVCEPCNVLIPDQYVPTLATLVCCPDCGRPCEKSWHRPSRPLFRSFTVDLGSGPTEITSLSQIRSIERESERRARDKAGQQVVFRAFSQDHSNQDVNTLRARGVHQVLPQKSAKVRPSRGRARAD